MYFERKKIEIPGQKANDETLNSNSLNPKHTAGEFFDIQNLYSQGKTEM